MKKTANLGRFVAVLACIVSAAAFDGCAQTEADPGSSGETHFLSACSTSCGDRLACLCDVCTNACDTDADCAGLKATARCVTNCATAHKSCDVPCSTSSDCSALGGEFTCQEGLCRTRVVVEDASVAPADARPSAVAESGTDANSKAGKTPPSGADATSDAGHGPFATCSNPSSLRCSIADNCKVVACGGLAYDEQACPRNRCLSDADCGSADRCTYLSCAESGGVCNYVDDTCSCELLDICLTTSICDPVSTVGPRGDWLDLAVDWNEKCNSIFCSGSRNIAPDGTVTAVLPAGGAPEGGISNKPPLSALDLQSLTRIVNGPDFRSALQNGLSCDSQVNEGLSVSMSLKLSASILSRDVGGCIGGDNVFDDVYRILHPYFLH